MCCAGSSISLLFLAYTVISIFVEAITLMITVNSDISFDPNFHSKDLTGWDRYEILVYLLSQSSVNANITTLLSAAVATASFRSAKDVVHEDDAAQRTETEGDGVTTTVDKEDTFFLRIVLFAIMFLILVPTPEDACVRLSTMRAGARFDYPHAAHDRYKPPITLLWVTCLWSIIVSAYSNLFMDFSLRDLFLGCGGS